MEEQKKNEVISIVIPVYNAAPYLQETIESVQNQTYKNWELILVDDASTDGSMQLLKNYAAEYKTDAKAASAETNRMADGENKGHKIKILSLPENKGPAAARNAGIREAEGRYLVFLDADDIWDKDKLKKQLAFMKEKQCAFSFTGYEFADETAARNGKVVHVPEKIVYEEALKNTTISTITVMFDREKLPEELLWMPENCQREDTATWWNILKHGYAAYGLDEPLSVYRRHAGSHSANKWNAVRGTWRMYRNQEMLSAPKAAYYMTFNLMNAVRRRI